MVDEEQPSYEEPPPEAYGRVTNPERYVVVQEAAAVLLDQLEQTYLVRRSEPNPDPDLVTRYGASHAVRLDPENDEAGPLVCTFSAFPGVMLTLGGGYEQAFPSCGCDACNEDPDRVVEELQRTSELMAQGALVEAVEGNFYSFRIGGLSGTTVISDDDPRRMLPRFRSWTAWSQR
jgi:hypothetical protein